MIILLKRQAAAAQVDFISRLLAQAGYPSSSWQEPTGTVIGVIGVIALTVQEALAERLEQIPDVERVVCGTSTYPMASREWKEGPSLIPIRDNLSVGGDELVIIAGPCAVESRERLLQAAWEVKERGADMLRGGAFKPRTSPHAFQGLGAEGLAYLREASLETGLPIVTEVMDSRDLDSVEEVADVLQIGSRNMQNYALLKAVGQS